LDILKKYEKVVEIIASSQAKIRVEKAWLLHVLHFENLRHTKLMLAIKERENKLLSIPEPGTSDWQEMGEQIQSEKQMTLLAEQREEA